METTDKLLNRRDRNFLLCSSSMNLYLFDFLSKATHGFTFESRENFIYQNG